MGYTEILIRISQNGAESFIRGNGALTEPCRMDHTGDGDGKGRGRPKQVEVEAAMKA